MALLLLGNLGGSVLRASPGATRLCSTPHCPARPCRELLFSRRGVPREQRTSAAQTSAASFLSTEDVDQLTERILELEVELQDMFQSGRPMPKAAVVNEMRENIQILKAQLAELVSAAKPGAAAVPAQPNGRANFAASGGAKLEQAVNSESSSESSVDDETLAKAQLILQGLIQPVEFKDPRLDAEFNVELALLEAENERLREEAQVLLMRQQLLEEIAAQTNTVVRRRAKRVKMTRKA